MARAQLAVVAGLVAVMLLMAPRTANATLCVDVIDAFASCLPYIGGEDPRPSPVCCSGIEEIAGIAAQSTADKRAACGCLKNLLAILRGIEPEEIARIPSMCDVNMPFAISATADCTGITLINVA